MWSAPQYLKFANERTRPCSDLVSQISLERPAQIIDLGCGPGNSTAVLRDRWPDAEVTGVDSSPEMIATARKNEPTGRWVHAKITEWAAKALEQYDLVFSNAALHWVPDHQRLYPLLFARSAAALAVQMPASFEAPAHVLMREIAESPRWKPLFPEMPQWHARSLEFYFDLLSPAASALDLWETEYVHVLPNAEAIVEWFKGTALRPYLDFLEDGKNREGFLEEYLSGVRERYPLHHGQILFPFRRTFLIAYK